MNQPAPVVINESSPVAGIISPITRTIHIPNSAIQPMSTAVRITKRIMEIYLTKYFIIYSPSRSLNLLEQNS